MNINSELKQKLFDSFKHELEDNAASLTDYILTLEKQLSENPKKTEDISKTIKELLRLAHNIKGASRVADIPDVSVLAHHIETLILKIQENPNDDLKSQINIIFSVLDAIKSITLAKDTGKSLSGDLVVLLQQIQNPSKETEKQQIGVKSESIAPETDSVRIAVSKLDQLNVLSDSLQMNLLQLKDCEEKIKKSNLNETEYFDLDYLKNALKDLERTIYDFQYETKLLRLIPAALLLDQVPRMIRDLSQELNKTVDVEIHGQDIEVDRKVLNKLSDPLIHLLRNAIDHGIETTEERMKMHKPATGKITINVMHQGEKILFQITDDGRGIDKDNIIKMAIARRLIKAEEVDHVSEKEITALIFRSGFSTKQMITAVSGRGVGLDVVSNNVNSINGSVSIESKPHIGTTVTLTVPLTIATNRGLIVRSHSQLFFIPTLSIDRLVSVGLQDLTEVEGNIVITVENSTVPLRDLQEVLYHTTAKLEKKRDRLLVVILDLQWRKLGLIVEEILGESSLVIKPLSNPLHHTPCVTGGALYQEGSIALVLNPIELFQLAGTSVKLNKKVYGKKSEDEIKQHILVVDDSITTRILEKNILENHGYQVTTASDGLEAINMLNKQQFDLIVTDVLMPHMDGFELTKKIKTSEQYHHLPVIIVTTLDSDSEKQQGMEAGANAYIVKHEFESHVLINMVRQLI